MVFFITVLRALAACIITNAHYTGVYPTDLIANGGLLGDVIFFAVSGFCLANVKENFPKWYAKRLTRIIPVTWIITAIYGAVGLINIEFNLKSILSAFIYPTRYHFVSSILILYIPFYFIMKFDKLRANIMKVGLAVAGVWVIGYIFFYDKSYYHIDTVREPMIRFLFLFSMLLGAYFRVEKDKYLNKKCIGAWIALPFLFAGYFASKMIFVKTSSVSQLQILNQVVLFLLLFVIFRCFISIDAKLEKLPKPIKSIITFISSITLEIYLIQIYIIQELNFLPFPANWILITAAIVALAFLLNKLVKPISDFFNKIINKSSTDNKDIQR